MDNPETLEGAPEAPGVDDWPARGVRPAQPSDRWTRAGAADLWPGPVTPLTWSLIPSWAGLAMHCALAGRPVRRPEPQWADRFYGRIYFNQRALAKDEAAQSGGRMKDEKPSLHPSSFILPPFIAFLAALPSPIQYSVRAKRARAKLALLAATVDEEMATYRARDLGALADDELLDELDGRLARAEEALRLLAEAGRGAYQGRLLLSALLGWWLVRAGGAGHVDDLLDGLGEERAGQMAADLRAIAQALAGAGLGDIAAGETDPGLLLARLRKLPAAGPALAALDVFLERQGHRGPGEWELLNPRWLDAPEQALSAAAAYLRRGDPRNEGALRAATERRPDEERGAGRGAAKAWVCRRLNPLQASLFRQALTGARDALCLREDVLDCFMKSLYTARLICAEFGRRWQRRGWLAHTHDIFFLGMLDIEQLVETGNPAILRPALPILIMLRARAYEFWHDVNAPDALGPTGETPRSGSLRISSVAAIQNVTGFNKRG